MKIKRIILISVIILTAVLVFGCGGGETTPTATSSEPAVAQDGDTVAVHYIGTLEDGTKFDSSYDRGQPLEFVLGAGNMISGFENAVRGMQVGEVKTVTLPPEEAYGPYREDLVQTFSRDELPEGLDPQVGDTLRLQVSGQTIAVPVVAVTATDITLDLNPPLAGKALTFEIELISIQPAE